MIKVPPWLFSAESDVYKTPRHMKDRPTRFAGDRVVARYWSVTRADDIGPLCVHAVAGFRQPQDWYAVLKKWYAADIVRGRRLHRHRRPQVPSASQPNLLWRRAQCQQRRCYPIQVTRRRGLSASPTPYLWAICTGYHPHAAVQGRMAK